MRAAQSCGRRPFMQPPASWVTHSWTWITRWAWCTRPCMSVARTWIACVPAGSSLVSVAFHAALTLLAAGLTLVADRRMISVDLPKSIVYGFVAITLLAATIVAARRLFTRTWQNSEQILREIEQSAAGEELV